MFLFLSTHAQCSGLQGNSCEVPYFTPLPITSIPNLIHYLRLILSFESIDHAVVNGNINSPIMCKAGEYVLVEKALVFFVDR
jgi:hypothetical protein